jgi:hypothetical protein
MSSIIPIIEIIKAHMPIVIKAGSALPKKIVAMKKANEVATPPYGGIFLSDSLFSFLIFFFL